MAGKPDPVRWRIRSNQELEPGNDTYFAAGLSGQKVSSDAFRLGQEKFSIGGSVGAGVRLPVSPQVAIRFDADANLYSWRFRTGLPSTSQLDVLLAAGLELRLRR